MALSMPLVATFPEQNLPENLRTARAIIDDISLGKQPQFNASVKSTTDAINMIFIYAAQKGFDKLARFTFILGADLNIPDENGRSALLNTFLCEKVNIRDWNSEAVAFNQDIVLSNEEIRERKYAIAKIILSSGRLQLEEREKNQILLAAIEAFAPLVTINNLLDIGCSIEASESEGSTALMLAIRSGNRNAARLLLNRGALVEVQNKYGITPLMLAAQRGDQELVLLLLNDGAQRSTQDRFGKSAAHYAARIGDLKLFTLLSEHPLFERIILRLALCA